MEIGLEIENGIEIEFGNLKYSLLVNELNFRLLYLLNLGVLLVIFGCHRSNFGSRPQPFRQF